MTEEVDKAKQDAIESRVRLTWWHAARRGGLADGSPLRICFYIDALNLYYGALRHTPYRWLNYLSLCDNICKNINSVEGFVRVHPESGMSKKGLANDFANYQLVKVKIFTARVKSIPFDEDAPKRHEDYLDAMCAIDSQEVIKIVDGYFKSDKKSFRDAYDPQQKHRILHMEEKCTDVNLALHMLNDAVGDVYDCAIMVSNDCDLREALPLTREKGKLVGIVFPQSEKPGQKRDPAKNLKNKAHFYCITNNNLLAASQLPNPVMVGNKYYGKPLSWDGAKKEKKWRGDYNFSFLAKKFIKTICIRTKRYHE